LIANFVQNNLRKSLLWWLGELVKAKQVGECKSGTNEKKHPQSGFDKGCFWGEDAILKNYLIEPVF